MIRKILNSYRSRLELDNIRPVKVILYGSFAYGKPDKWSGIDVVVIARSYGKRNILERMEFLSQKVAGQSIFKEIITQGQEL